MEEAYDLLPIIFIGWLKVSAYHKCTRKQAPINCRASDILGAYFFNLFFWFFSFLRFSFMDYLKFDAGLAAWVCRLHQDRACEMSGLSDCTGRLC